MYHKKEFPAYALHHKLLSYQINRLNKMILTQIIVCFLLLHWLVSTLCSCFPYKILWPELQRIWRTRMNRPGDTKKAKHNNIFASHVSDLIHLSDAYVHYYCLRYTQNWKTIENNNFRIERLPKHGASTKATIVIIMQRKMVCNKQNQILVVVVVQERTHTHTCRRARARECVCTLIKKAHEIFIDRMRNTIENRRKNVINYFGEVLQREHNTIIIINFVPMYRSLSLSVCVSRFPSSLLRTSYVVVSLDLFNHRS